MARSPLRGVTRVLPMSGRRGRVSSVHYIFPCAVHLTSTHQADGCDAIRSRSESFSILWPDVRTWPGQCPSLSAFAPELPASCRSYDGCTWSMPSRTKAGPGGFAQALACRLRSAAKTMLCTSGYEVPHQLWPAGCGRRLRRSRTEYALHNKGCPGGFAQALACRLRSAAKTMLCTSGYDVLHQLWPAGCGRRPRRSHEEYALHNKGCPGGLHKLWLAGFGRRLRLCSAPAAMTVARTCRGGRPPAAWPTQPRRSLTFDGEAGSTTF